MDTITRMQLYTKSLISQWKGRRIASTALLPFARKSPMQYFNQTFVRPHIGGRIIPSEVRIAERKILKLLPMQSSRRDALTNYFS